MKWRMESDILYQNKKIATKLWWLFSKGFWQCWFQQAGGQEKSCRQLHFSPTNDEAISRVGRCKNIPQGCVVAARVWVLSDTFNDLIVRIGHTGVSLRDRTVTKTCIKPPVVTVWDISSDSPLRWIPCHSSLNSQTDEFMHNCELYYEKENEGSVYSLTLSGRWRK